MNRKKILFVDDERVFAILFKSVLEEHGFDVVHAGTGEEALDIVKSDPQVNLALLDINLGMGMDGYETARAILDFKALPVVFLTSHSEEEILRGGRDIPHYGYVIKTSGKHVIVSSVEKAFELYEAHRRMKESEEKYRLLFEKMSGGVIFYDSRGLIVSANPAAGLILGIPRQEMPGTALQDHGWVFITEEGGTLAPEHMPVNAALRTGRALTEQLIGLVNPEKERALWLILSAVPQFLKGESSPYQIYSIFTDITEIIEAKSALRNKERQLSDILDNIQDAYFRTDRNGKIIMASPSAVHLFGYGSIEELIGMPACNVYGSPAERDRLVEILRAQGSFQDCIVEMRKKDGTSLWVSMNAQFYHDGKGGVQGTEGFLRDITRRVQAEEILQKSRKSLEAQLELHRMMDAPQEKIFDFVIEASLDLTASEFSFFGFMNRNESTMTIHRWSQGAMARCAIENSPLCFSMAGAGLWGDCVRRREPCIINSYGKDIPGARGCPEGHVPIRRFLAVPVFDGDAIVAVAAVANKRDDYGKADCDMLSNLIARTWEIVRRKKAERELEEQKALLEDMVEMRTTALYTANMSLNTEVAFRKQVEEELQKHREHLEDLVRERTEELEKANTKFLHAQKIDGIGRMAGGVAHDFNNLLTAIIGFTSLVRDSLAMEDGRREDLDLVLSTAGSAAELTRQLLAFSRLQKASPIIVDISAITLAMHRMLRRLVREEIDIDIIPAEGRALVSIDPGMYEQLIVNLVVNAQDAIEREGVITIRLAISDWQSYEMPGSRAVILEVADTGAGMTDKVKEHLFEPFFTTKETGKGTGLGLATVYGIVKQHRGEISVASAAGSGTAFTLTFPLVTQEESEQRTEEKAPPEPQGTGTVMVVEDAKEVRSFIARALTSMGYSVLEAENGVNALEMSKGCEGEIDAVVTDMIMPLMNGKVLVEKMRAARPGIRALFVSGYMGEITLDIEEDKGRSSFLQKPFSVEALAAKMRELLDRSP
ncbi:MAG: response regulator [Candidatus Eremiobacteraeota bacterium]|nr:response regulator [Candidatus Eremiobacteraeota bacterium]